MQSFGLVDVVGKREPGQERAPADERRILGNGRGRPREREENERQKRKPQA